MVSAQGFQIFFKIGGPKWPMEQKVVNHFLKWWAQHIKLSTVDIWVVYFTYTLTQTLLCIYVGARWLSGRVLDSRPKGRGFEPHRRHCGVSLNKNINPSLVLVQSRKTRPYITERLLMGRKESNQANKLCIYVYIDCWLYSKTCLSGHSKEKTSYRLMKVKSIAECSKGIILQSFWPSLSYHLSLNLCFVFLSGCWRQAVFTTYMYCLFLEFVDSL